MSKLNQLANSKRKPFLIADKYKNKSKRLSSIVKSSLNIQSPIKTLQNQQDYPFQTRLGIIIAFIEIKSLDLIIMQQLPVVQQALEHNYSSQGNKRFFYCRIYVLLTILVLLLVYTNVNFHDSVTNVNCYYDAAFEVTKSANEYFRENKGARDALLITDQILIDTLAMTTLFRWCTFGKSWLPIVTMVMFYACRSFVQVTILIQILFQMDEPEGYLWKDPGFPSIFVSYKQPLDFFYSGHMAFCVWNMIHHFTEKHKIHFIFSIVVTVVTFSAQIMLRGHFISDLLTGAVMAHYSHLICKSTFCPWIDKMMSWQENKKQNINQRNQSQDETDQSNEQKVYSQLDVKEEESESQRLLEEQQLKML